MSAGFCLRPKDRSDWNAWTCFFTLIENDHMLSCILTQTHSAIGLHCLVSLSNKLWYHSKESILAFSQDMSGNMWSCSLVGQGVPEFQANVFMCMSNWKTLMSQGGKLTCCHKVAAKAPHVRISVLLGLEISKATKYIDLRGYLSNDYCTRGLNMFSIWFAKHLLVCCL